MAHVRKVICENITDIDKEMININVERHQDYVMIEHYNFYATGKHGEDVDSVMNGFEEMAGIKVVAVTGLNFAVDVKHRDFYNKVGIH